MAEKHLQTTKKNKGGLPKGRTNNPNGRKRGSKNKKTLEWEEFGRQIIEGSLPDIVNYMSDLADKNPQLHFDNFSKLVNYFKPQLSRSEITGKDGKDLIPNSSIKVKL